MHNSLALFFYQSTGPAEIIVEVADNGDGTFTASYTPPLPGDYNLVVTCNAAPIAEAERTVHIEGPAGANCTVTGAGVEGGEAVEGATQFSIESYNAAGERVTNAGDKFEAVVTGPDGVELAAEIADNGDGTYTGAYPVALSGDYTVNVSLYGDAVGQSPYTARMGADAAQCVAYGPGLDGGFNNVQATFTIEARDVHGTKLNGPDGSEFAVTVR